MEIGVSPRISPQDEWFIAHNNNDVVIGAFNEQGTRIETGQPYFEVFDNEQEYLNRLTELGVTPQEEI